MELIGTSQNKSAVIRNGCNNPLAVIGLRDTDVKAQAFDCISYVNMKSIRNRLAGVQ